jgi:lysophospholipase L1-like esterase
VERGPDDFRVLCLGDSITFGWGVRYEEAYPTLLAELLREARPGREIQVLNASCSGYSIHQGQEMLRRNGLKYRPDVVTIWFGWNDKHPWDGMTDAEHARLFAREDLLSRSATYRVLAYALRRHAHEDERKERKDEGEGLPRVPLPEYQARLREMVELARASEVEPGRGARVVLIQGCFRDQMRSPRKRKGRFELDAYQKATARLAEELDAPMLSVCDALSQAGLGRKDFLDSGHLKPEALRVVAEALFALMAERGMLPGPAGSRAALP